MATTFPFPASPMVGQQILLADGVTKLAWTGYSWEPPFIGVGTLAYNKSTIDDIEPLAPIINDRWIKPSTGEEMVRIPVAGGGMWMNFAAQAQIPLPLSVSNGGTGSTVEKYLPLAGGTVTGLLTAGGGCKVEKVSSDVVIEINGSPGYSKGLFMESNGVVRWKVLSHLSAGDPFVIERFNDAGVYQGAAVSIDRATGQSRFNSRITISDPAPDYLAGQISFENPNGPVNGKKSTITQQSDGPLAFRTLNDNGTQKGLFWLDNSGVFKCMVGGSIGNVFTDLGGTINGAVTINSSVNMSLNSFTAGNMELGYAGQTGNWWPFIDFHTIASSNDYDVRIIGIGGSGTAGTNGRGNLTIQANEIGLASAYRVYCDTSVNATNYYSRDAGRWLTDYALRDSITYVGLWAGDYNKPYMSGSDTCFLLRQINGTLNFTFRNSGYIEWSTNIGAVGCNYFVSDERKKENITAPDYDALPMIEATEMIGFNYRENTGFDSATRHPIGFSSQKLQAVNPDWVIEMSDGFLAPNPPEILPCLFRAVQELLAKIRVLEARLT